MRVDAVITDLDGTFWGAGMAVHDATLEAVRRIDDAGIPFVVATGRRAQGALKGLAPIGLDDRPAILMNGALARDTVRGPSFLVESIVRDDALGVVDIFDGAELEPIVYIDHPDTDMVIGPQPSAGAEYLAHAPGVRAVGSITDAVADATTIGFGAFGFPRDRLAPIADEINRRGLATAIIGASLLEGDHGLMIQARDVDKQTGIAAWCARHGVDPDRVAAVGDANNDIDMLRAAAVAIVPTNASAEIRALADVLIEPNEEGGWKQIPEILGL